MPPGGGFSGNRSVDWFVATDDARPQCTTVRSVGNYGIRHEGIEDTQGGGYRFVITIRHPRKRAERDKFLKQLTDAAADTGSRTTVLTIPVEDKQSGYTPRRDSQITVGWKPPRGARARPGKKYKKPKSEPIDIRF